MSDWRGLHNPERHYLPDGRSDCAVCRCLPEGHFCESDNPCRCCLYMEWISARKLRAEVERLTGLLEAADNVVAAQDRRIEAALAYCDELKPIAFGWKIARILRGESDA